jgi:hypothetical protein
MNTRTIADLTTGDTFRMMPGGRVLTVVTPHTDYRLTYSDGDLVCAMLAIPTREVF